MAMWRFPIDIRIEREPGLHAVVDNVMATMRRNDRAMAPRPAPDDAPQPYGEIMDFPSAGSETSKPWPTGNRRPFISEGNRFGGSLSGGQIFGPSQVIPPHIAEVEPIDSLDATGKRHDLHYDRLLRDVYELLENGLSNSEALAYFHRGAIEADRNLAEDIKSASPSTPYGVGLRLGSQVNWLFNPLNWAANRQEILGRLQGDESYRRYVDRLPVNELFERLSSMGVFWELYRLRRAHDQEELMERAQETYGVP